jgi:hypothetical protein
MVAIVCPIGDTNESVESTLDVLSDLPLDYIDHDGHHFKMTIACDPCAIDPVTFDRLSELCASGAGEMEYMLSSVSHRSGVFENELERALAAFNSQGWASTNDSTISFAIIGNMAWDDSITVLSGKQLRRLASAGCYADLSSPTMASPICSRRCNSIYAASSESTEGSSSVSTSTLKAGAISKGEVLVIDSPLLIDWMDWRNLTAPFVEEGHLRAGDSPDRRRAMSWIRANVHVTGRPDWIFVKLIFDIQSNTTATRRESSALRQALEHMESLCGDQFRLHYVTAREMCNIARAAEARKSGDAGQYRDYLVKPYIASLGSIAKTRESERVVARQASAGKYVVD